MDELMIGDVARRAGVRTSTVRYYERIGLLPAPKRVNGRRRYGAAAIQQLAVIQLAQQAGFALAEVRALLDGFPEQTPPGDRWRPLAAQKLPEMDALLTHLLQTRATLIHLQRCDCPSLDMCVAEERRHRNQWRSA